MNTSTSITPPPNPAQGSATPVPIEPIPIPHWIDGKPTPGSGRVSPVYDPSLGRVIREVSLADKAEVDRAVASAARAFPAGRNSLTCAARECCFASKSSWTPRAAHRTDHFARARQDT